MNAITKVDPAADAANVPAVTSAPRGISSVGIFSDPVRFEFMQRAARVFAESDLVPPHMKGKLSNCLIALNIADRLQEDPLVVMQNIVIVSNRPGWMTAYMIARANRYGVFHGRITWKEKGTGKDLVITASATLADTGEEVSATVSMVMAEAEGWTKNPKYKSMPELMLRYRSAAMLIRLYCPEVMLGFPTVEEIDTVEQPMRDVTPRPVAITPAATDLAPPEPPAPDDEPLPAKLETDAAPEPPSAELAAKTRQPSKLRLATAAAAAADPKSFPGVDATFDALKAWVETLLADATPDTLPEIWNEKIEPAIEPLFPGDKEDLMGVYRARERELA